MDTNLFLANAAFGVALALFGILIRVLFARVSTNERSSNERFAQHDSRIAATESMHASAAANHAWMKELFDHRIAPLRKELDETREDIKALNKNQERFRELLTSVQEQVNSVYSALETVKVLLSERRGSRNA